MTLGKLFKKYKIKKVLKFGFIFFGVNFFILCLALYRNQSQRFMPDEYKLVQKIFNKISLNNDLGDRPISISIRAGEYMHWKLKNLGIGICEDAKNSCAYYVNLNPFRRFMGFRAVDINNAIKQSYLFGAAGASANPAGFIAIDRATFRVLEGNEPFIASIIAHEMNHILNFSDFKASFETLKISLKEKNKSEQELEDIFFNKYQLGEIEADMGGALMIYNAGYPKDTFSKAIEFAYKQIGIIHAKSQAENHPDFIKRMKLINAFMKDENFKKEKIINNSSPLTWEYNRNGNWLKFYPNKK